MKTLQQLKEEYNRLQAQRRNLELVAQQAQRKIESCSAKLAELSRQISDQVLTQ